MLYALLQLRLVYGMRHAQLSLPLALPFPLSAGGKFHFNVVKRLLALHANGGLSQHTTLNHTLNPRQAPAHPLLLPLPPR